MTPGTDKPMIDDLMDLAISFLANAGLSKESRMSRQNFLEMARMMLLLERESRSKMVSHLPRFGQNGPCAGTPSFWGYPSIFQRRPTIFRSSLAWPCARAVLFRPGQMPIFGKARGTLT
jgi:hypothetical protein